MPSLPTEASNVARDVAFDLINRASGSRVTSSGGRGVRSTARVIGGGIIAAIVIACVVGIAAVILAIFLFRRHKKQRQIRDKEMQKYYGDNRTSMGSSNYNPNTTNPTTNPPGGYNYGQGYGYGNTATPGQYGYGASNGSGVTGVPPAHTADHVTTK